MNLEEYKAQLYEDIKVSAEANIIDATSEFIRYVTDILVDSEELYDFTECYFETTGKRGRKIQIDGYNLDEVDNSCSLIISNFTNKTEMSTITDSQIDILYRKMEAFIDHAISGFIEESCEESSCGYELALRISEELNNITKFRFYIITDQIISKRVKSVKKDSIYDKPVELNVWDISRLYDIEMSKTGKEEIEIDLSEFGINGLPCVKGIESEIEQYSAYLMTIPGDILAKIYLEYGARLLEGNVRSFLSNRSNVNKGIRKTIITNPEMFFAYNNGIAATASEIDFASTEYGMVIKKIRDLQIINGGQTTASIANAVLNKEGDVSKAFVPMKLSVVDSEKAQEIIPDIDRCANSQNKIDEADFASNHPFNVRMEGFSRKILAPAVDGNQYQMGWFYERARGQYVQAQMKLTKSEKKAFAVKWPKTHLIKKVDLAKYINTFEEKPYIVSKGAQASASHFHVSMKKQWDKSDEKFNALYYKQMICLGILYKSTENIISNQDWYKAVKSYRANIVTYSLSAIFNQIRKMNNKEFDFKLIWNSQKISNEMEEQLVITSKEVFNFITRDDRLTLNVTQWCKQEICWERAKKENWTILPDFIESLVSKEDFINEESEAKVTQKVNNEVNDVMKIIKLKSYYWDRLFKWSDERKLLSPIERDFIKLAKNIESTGKIPSAKQAKRILEINEKILMEGFQ